MARLLCWLGWHRKPRGLASDYAWTWTCTRCNQPQNGGLGR